MLNNSFRLYMIKRKLFFILLLLIPYVVFANDFETDIWQIINKSENFTAVNKSQEKTYIKVLAQTNEEFTRKTRVNLDTSIFPDKQNVSFEQIYDSLKACKNIFAFTQNEYLKFEWKEGKSASYSIMYSQNIKGPAYSAGVYVLRVFYEDMVYTIRLADLSDTENQNSGYDKLDDYFVYKTGRKTDPARGIEGTQGYYFISKEKAEAFYNLLKSRDSKLPESAVNFQLSAEYILNFLADYE